MVNLIIKALATRTLLKTRGLWLSWKDQTDQIRQFQACPVTRQNANSQQQAGGVSDGDIPVLVFCVSLGVGLCEVENAAVFLHHAAFFQVVNIGAFGMQDGF